MRICLCSKNSFILIIDLAASMEKLICSGPSDAASVRDGVEVEMMMMIVELIRLLVHYFIE